MRSRPLFALLALSVGAASCHLLVEPEPRTRPSLVTGIVTDADTVALVDVPVSVRLYAPGCAAALPDDSALARTGEGGRFAAMVDLPPTGRVCVRATVLPPPDSFWAPTTVERDGIGGAGVDLQVVLREARLVFNYLGPRTGAFGPEAATARFDDGGGWRTVQGRDFSSRGGAPRSSVFRTRMGDSIRVEVEVSGGGSPARGSLTLPVRADWIWGVDIHLANRSPLPGCFGCLGARAFPLGPDAPADSLFLVWGGNYISRPVVH